MELRLKYGLRWANLHENAGLQQLDAAFIASLPVELAAEVKAARASPLPDKSESLLILALAPLLDDFIADLFAIRAEVNQLNAAHHVLAPLYLVKRQLVQRRAAKLMKPEEAAQLSFTPRDELAFATAVAGWLADETAYHSELAEATRYAAWALYSEAGRQAHSTGILFKLPHKIDPANLVPHQRDLSGCITGLPAHLRARKGFDLTDPGTDLRGALDEVNYCIWCAHQGKDSCSKGLLDRTTGAFQKNTGGTTLTGCPLEEKISEFQETKAKGFSIGALGIITIDNPLCAATGHRICNDCMKSCIYQKQEPVDIPQAETRTLKDVLNLPWGFEIYSLLTRWNPLNFRRPLPLPESGKSVLVAGLGPAGFTLAHHLLNDGHHVFALDGLKLEPLPFDLLTTPIHDVSMLYEQLSNRIMAGFGGVAEYGITVRWNKNFLKLIRLLLERRARFDMAGGVRLGGTLTLEDAFARGFDHVALCMGAGRPTVIDMPNNLAKGVRQASDFLMALQLTGAAKADSLANLELELPVVVIGGGLTAIDTATEALAYYPVQVEKFLMRQEQLARPLQLAPAEQQRADTFITHAKALRAAPDWREKLELLNRWGGVTIAYRKGLNEAPSYTLNHEEVELALQEGIRIRDHATPAGIEVDDDGHATALKLADGTTLPARSILVAAGTQPNTVLARETAGIELDGKYFRAIDEAGQPVQPERLAKPHHAYVMMDERVSFFGDLHPSFAGNVVKAMGSATRGYPVISSRLAVQPARSVADAVLKDLKRDLSARVVAVNRLTPTIIEVLVQAKQAVAKFEPGQFYRLQNFESLAEVKQGTRLAMEGLALTGASVDKATGIISLVVLEMGGSSDLVAKLKVDEPVVLMGPTGTPTHIPENETVLLIGGGLGNAVLFSIGAACRAKGNRVLYFAGYKKLADRYKVAELEAAADEIIWCCDEAPGFVPSRPQDSSFTGNMLQALAAHGDKLKTVDRILCIGSDRLMAAVADARHNILKPYLKTDHLAIGSINSPMQCMMKEICAQCLQRQRDPVTGEEKIVFSCFNQDQPLDHVDFKCLAERLGQNSLAEKQTAAWLKHCLT